MKGESSHLGIHHRHRCLKCNSLRNNGWTGNTTKVVQGKPCKKFFCYACGYTAHRIERGVVLDDVAEVHPMPANSASC